MNSFNDKYIIVFDGECAMCNWAVELVYKFGKEKNFVFLPLSLLYKESSPTVAKADSIMLLYNNRVYYASDAVLKTLYLLGGIWCFAQVFYLVPEKIRDSLYYFIARNRKKWFGKSVCRVPVNSNMTSPEEIKKLISQFELFKFK